MEHTANGWSVVDEAAGVLSYEYSFAPGASANSFATRIADGKMMVVSPPARVSAGVYDDVEAFGGVAALVAPNGFHHLGLAEWKKRFPDARVFADPLATKRIAKKNRDAPTPEPIAGLQSMLGRDVVYTPAPATKCGESWVSTKTAGGWVWYASDVLANLQTLPSNFVIRTLFKLTGTSTGYGVFHTAMKFIVADRKRVLRQMADEIAERAPKTMIPGHGPMLDDADIADRTRTILADAIQ